MKKADERRRPHGRLDVAFRPRPLRHLACGVGPSRRGGLGRADNGHTDSSAWLLRTELRPSRLELSPDGTPLAVAGVAGEPLLVIDARTGAVKAQLRALNAGVTAFAWSPDGA